MNSAEKLDYVIIYDENGEPQKRPRNLLYEKVAAKQEELRRSPMPREQPLLIRIEGEPLSHTIIRERRGEFD